MPALQAAQFTAWAFDSTFLFPMDVLFARNAKDIPLRKALCCQIPDFTASHARRVWAHNLRSGWCFHAAGTKNGLSSLNLRTAVRESPDLNNSCSTSLLTPNDTPTGPVRDPVTRGGYSRAEFGLPQFGQVKATPRNPFLPRNTNLRFNLAISISRPDVCAAGLFRSFNIAPISFWWPDLFPTFNIALGFSCGRTFPAGPFSSFQYSSSLLASMSFQSSGEE